MPVYKTFAGQALCVCRLINRDRVVMGNAGDKTFSESLCESVMFEYLLCFFLFLIAIVVRPIE